MLKKIALTLALATALVGALPAFAGMAFAQATVPWGGAPRTITATVPADGLIQFSSPPLSFCVCRKARCRRGGFLNPPPTQIGPSAALHMHIADGELAFARITAKRGANN